jgi:hypothetical protein
MNERVQDWSYRDLRFVVDTLVPGARDREHLVALVQDDPDLLAGMIEDDRLFQSLMADEEIFVSVSPLFFFKVLLLRARRDLEREAYTIERRNMQKVALFDAQQVADLLSNSDLTSYLASLLASFTRVRSVTITFQTRPGAYHRLQVNDLDVDSLVRYAQIVAEEQRFAIYQRIADACLFLAGIFPEHIETQRRYPHTGAPRRRLTTSLLHDLEGFENYGRTFYRLAARHRLASAQGLEDVLKTLSRQFILARKPLNFIAERYLTLRKHRLFDFGG